MMVEQETRPNEKLIELIKDRRNTNNASVMIEKTCEVVGIAFGMNILAKK